MIEPIYLFDKIFNWTYWFIYLNFKWKKKLDCTICTEIIWDTFAVFTGLNQLIWRGNRKVLERKIRISTAIYREWPVIGALIVCFYLLYIPNSVSVATIWFIHSIISILALFLRQSPRMLSTRHWWLLPWFVWTFHPHWVWSLLCPNSKHFRFRTTQPRWNTKVISF